MGKHYLIFLLCIITSFTVRAQNGGDDDADEVAVFNPKIGFKDFKVAVYKGHAAKLNIHSSRTARMFRTALREGYKNPKVNFAGHYMLVSWGCGSPCSSGAIIDVKNGKVYDIPGSGIGYRYKPNSRLLLVDPPWQNLPDTNWYYHKNRPYEVPYICIFNERTKKFKNYPYLHDK